ncbi:MAG TPA: response regulator [Polyangiaceae bacterium]|nr:response regulator [Polyangiaceae bacterium]
MKSTEEAVPVGSASGPSLTTRLVWAIAAPMVLLVAVGAILGLQISRMRESAAWVDHTDTVLLKLEQLERLMSSQEAALRGYQLNHDPTFAEDYDAATPSTLADELQHLVSDNPEQLSRLSLVRQQSARWQALAAKVFAGPAGVDSALVNERRRIAQSAHETLEQMRGAEHSLRRQRAIALENATDITKWAFVSLILLTALALGFFSRRNLTEVTKAFSATLGREREARQKVEQEEWMRGGLLAVSDATRGELSLPDLTSRALSALAPYVGADIGALFVREAFGFRRQAGFALEQGGAGLDYFPEGEGLIGRAAYSSAVVHVQDLPESYLKIRGGTGDAEPNHLLLAAARHEGGVLAVVELGFLRTPEARVRLLLDRVGETIAAAIHSARQRLRLQELLEESQRQAEELQAQQEELRVTNEELHEQSAALQQTQAQLRERQEELEASNANLEQQASDLEAAERRLREKANELERASRYKSEFLANMSHELRTPLNSSLILAKLLADNRDGNLNAEQIKFANTIYSAGNDLLALINDILDLSKIEAGQMDVNAAPTAISALIDPLLATFTPIAQERNLTLSVKLDPGLPNSIETDAQRVQQILKNLLSNALKFTERGAVTLSVTPHGDRLEFSVADEGIGIPADQHEAVFQAFRQADGTVSRKYGGTGLGLSISRDLSRMLGGELSLESEPGKGSTFTLSLPRQYTGKRSRGGAASNAGVARASSVPAATNVQKPKPLGVADDRASLDARRRLLLVIEDDPAFAEILVDLAHELDFQCVAASSGEEGLRLAQELKPAAVLLDINLPDRSGLSVLDRLKHLSTTRHVPVHVVSVADYSSQALAMGAFGYMLKPVQREQLASALHRMEERLTRRLNRLLIVEDDATQRDAICKLLAADDVETVAVATTKEALAHLRTGTFDCVVTDLALPDASGFDLLEQMSADPAHAFPPVIVYTGRSLTEEEEARLRRHSSAIIVKGARSPERLLDEVTLFLHRVEADLPPDRRRMLAQARDRELAFEGRRILVVEDDVRNVFALSSLLEPKGAKVLIARNGQQALSMLEQNPGVDLVLMDVMMPEMDGIEATRRIRKRPDWRDLPIIALTAKAMSNDREDCLRAGANDYIAKPLDVDTLLSLCRVWIRK